MSRKNGRPRAYSDEHLKEVLYAYAKDHPEGKISPGKLEKETGIKSHIWRDRMRNEINRLNQKAITIMALNDTPFEYPNMIEEMLATGGDEKKMVALGERYNELLMGLAGELNKLQTAQAENFDLKDKVNELIQENRALKKACSDYKRIVSQMTIDARSNERRKRYGLTKDLLAMGDWEEVAEKKPDVLKTREVSSELSEAVLAITELDD